MISSTSSTTTRTSTTSSQSSTIDTRDELKEDVGDDTSTSNIMIQTSLTDNEGNEGKVRR